MYVVGTIISMSLYRLCENNSKWKKDAIYCYNCRLAMLNGDDILVVLILMIFKSSNFKYILVTYAWTYFLVIFQHFSKILWPLFKVYGVFN